MFIVPIYLFVFRILILAAIFHNLTQFKLKIVCLTILNDFIDRALSTFNIIVILYIGSRRYFEEKNMC